jgi:hypothetical protein
MSVPGSRKAGISKMRVNTSQTTVNLLGRDPFIISTSFFTKINENPWPYPKSPPEKMHPTPSM